MVVVATKTRNTQDRSNLLVDLHQHRLRSEHRRVQLGQLVSFLCVELAMRDSAPTAEPLDRRETPRILQEGRVQRTLKGPSK